MLSRRLECMGKKANFVYCNFLFGLQKPVLFTLQAKDRLKTSSLRRRHFVDSSAIFKVDPVLSWCDKALEMLHDLERIQRHRSSKYDHDEQEHVQCTRGRQVEVCLVPVLNCLY